MPRKRIDIFVEGIPGDNPRYKFEMTDVEGKLLMQGNGDLNKQCSSSLAAEYGAASVALNMALQFAMRPVPVTLRVKSRMLMNYLKGKWPVKKESLMPLHRQLSGLMAEFSDIQVRLYAGGVGQTVEKR